MFEELPSSDDLDSNTEEAKRRKAVRQALEGSNLSQSQRQTGQLPPLRDIPAIFFEENFDLANPRTFDVVTQSETSSGKEHQTLSDFATDQFLQDKLSNYLEIVEAHLSVEISIRSASFFSALSNLQDLNAQSTEALAEISDLKEMLQEVDESIAQKSMQAVSRTSKRQELHSIEDALERIKAVIQAVEEAQDMAEAGETHGALDLIEALENEWDESQQPSNFAEKQETHSAVNSTQSMPAIAEEQEEQDHSLPPKTPLTAFLHREGQHPPVRIAQIQLLSQIPNQLSLLRNQIAQALEHELSAILTHEIREANSALQRSRTKSKWEPFQESWSQRTSETLSAKTVDVLAGLLRCGKPAIDSAMAAWREMVIKEMRRLLKSLLPQQKDAVEHADAPSDASGRNSRNSFDGSSTETSCVRRCDDALGLT